MSAEARLVELGIVLPEAPPAQGLYAAVVRAGPLLFVSGQLPLVNGMLARRGRCGADVSLEEGAALARTCALNALAHIRADLGSLDRVTRIVRVGGFVAAAPFFIEIPAVINGASQLLIDIFGDAGRSARTSVGVAELPLGAPVEVEMVVESRGPNAG